MLSMSQSMSLWRRRQPSSPRISVFLWGSEPYWTRRGAWDGLHWGSLLQQLSREHVSALVPPLCRPESARRPWGQPCCAGRGSRRRPPSETSERPWRPSTGGHRHAWPLQPWQADSALLFAFGCLGEGVPCSNSHSEAKRMHCDANCGTLSVQTAPCIAWWLTQIIKGIKSE